MSIPLSLLDGLTEFERARLALKLAGVAQRKDPPQVKDKVRATITNKMFKEMQQRGLRRGMTARIVAFAVDNRLREFEQICFELQVSAREAALELWRQFAPSQTKRINVIPRRSIMEAPSLSHATYRIAN